MNNIIGIFTSLLVPIILLVTLIYGKSKNVDLYDKFTEGARESLKIIFKIFPNLLAMMLAINIFSASGGLEILTDLLRPVLQYLSLPEDVFPLFILRPLSGSASLAYIKTIFDTAGPDSLSGLIASTIQGSTETTFYILAVYFGSINVKKFGYALPAGLAADFISFWAAVILVKLIFV